MSKKWYQSIIEKIDLINESVLFIEDQDHLLNFVNLYQELDDRYLAITSYSSELRLRADLRKNKKSLVVIFKNDDDIPYDLSKDYSIIKISLEDIFPLLAKEALGFLDEAEIQELYDYYRQVNLFNRLSGEKTLAFILNSIYQVDISNPKLEAILAFLIKYFFAKEELKGFIKEFVLAKIRIWGLEQEDFIGRDKFYKWLAEEWRNFVIKTSKVDFSSAELKYLIDDCFEQGFIEPIDLKYEDFDLECIINESRNNYWLRSGIKNLEELSVEKEIKLGMGQIRQLLNQELLMREWGIVARVWGRILYLSYANELSLDLTSMIKELDNKFSNFITEKYNKLPFDQRFQYAPLNNRILEQINNGGEETKFALICFDCMSFKDWQLIKDYIMTELNLKVQEGFSLAMIPTVTSYSRQAIFSGKLPYEEQRNYREKEAFKEYITENSNIKEREIYFNNTQLPEKVDFLGYKAVGIIYRFIDQSLHNATDPTIHYKNLEHQLNRSNLEVVIDDLLARDFKVFFSSDHGNVFCTSNGIRLSRDLIEDKNIRAGLSKYKNLVKEIEVSNKLLLYLPNVIGDKYIVTVKDRQAFASQGASLVHGGANIEEVIIPLIEVKRNERNKRV